jgi:peroxiredoxin
VKRPLRLVALGALAILVTLFSLRRAGEPGLVVGEAAPALRLPSLAGGEVDLKSFRGHVVLLDFWATWCPACIEEMPSLVALHRMLAGEGLVVVGVSVDENPHALRRFVEEHGVGFLVLRDPSGLFAEQVYRTVEFPTSYVIDAEGIVRERFVGPVRWDAPGAVAHLRKQIAEARSQRSKRRTSPTR